MGGMSASGVLRAIAPLVDGIDTQQIDLVELTVHRDDPGVELTLDVPGQNSPDRWTVTATPTATTPATAETTTGDASTDPSGSSQVRNLEATTADDEPESETDVPAASGEPASSDDQRADAQSPLVEDPSAVARPPTWPTATQADPSPPSVRPVTRSDDGATRAQTQSRPVQCRVGGCDRTFDSQQAMRVHAAKAHAVEDNPERAAHRDPERLEAVYAAHETFAEMRDALGVDVTTQTVRRNMMKFGVHTPASTSDERSQSQSEDAGEEIAEASTSADERGESTPSRDHSGSTERAEETVSASPSGQKASGERQRESDASGGSVESSTELEREIRPVSLPGDVVVPPGTTVGDLVAAIQSADSPAEFRRALELGRGETQLLLSVLDVQPGKVEAGESGRDRLATSVVEMLDSSRTT